MNNHGKKVPKLHQDVDRRVKKTREALFKTMIALCNEKSWTAISVRELLERADVGRSTFYAHFKSKDDLLFSNFEQTLLTLDAAIEDERVAPVCELFKHAEGHLHVYRSLQRSGIGARLYNRGIDVYTHTILARLDQQPSAGESTASLRARAMAGALFAMLEGWISEPERRSPGCMDTLFHRLWREDGFHIAQH